MSLQLHEALSRHVYKTKLELARELQWFTDRGKPDTRRVEKAVEHARKAGDLPVMSGPDGYRLARNPDEYAYNVDRRHKRALVQLVTVQAEKKLLAAWRQRLNPTPPPPPPPAKPRQEALWGADGA
ncbi:MAG: hypothetical protein QOJ81_1332 [Chloroflexota bacterium]|jgi:hypothetical protein|nr:hypothetical protein [Chloroflexota bacterium]